MGNETDENVSVCINHADHKDSAHTGAKCGFCIACEDAGNGNPCPCGCEGVCVKCGFDGIPVGLCDHNLCHICECATCDFTKPKPL